MSFRRRRQTGAHAAAEHADLRAELRGDEFEFGDRLLGVVHRDDRGRGQPVAEPVEIIGRDDVVGADHGAPGLVVLDARQAQPGGRIDDREIDADLVEPGIEHFRHHRGGAVECVLGLTVPEIRLGDAAPARSSGFSLRASVVDLRAARNPSAPLSPPALRIFSLKTGAYSSQWPSPSTIGCDRFARISAGLACADIYFFSRRRRWNPPDVSAVKARIAREASQMRVAAYSHADSVHRLGSGDAGPVAGMDGAVAARAPGATPFQSPAWLMAWWKHFGTGAPRVLTARAGEGLVGVLPLYELREPGIRKLLPIGIGLSDYIDALVDPAWPESGGGDACGDCRYSGLGRMPFA